MKAIFLNASPRKNWNTAQILKSAQKGAESIGTDTEYFDLYDLYFTGCRSCLACKRKGAQLCKCYWNDDISSIIDKVFSADTLFIGSPIYLGDTTSQFHAFLERLHFCALSYDDYRNYFDGKVNVGIFLTMNVNLDGYKKFYEQKLSDQLGQFKALNGRVEIYPVCDTLQVDDYSKYNMAGFSEKHKRAVHGEYFPIDLENAFNLGAELSNK